MERISKRVREEAIEECLLAADVCISTAHWQPFYGALGGEPSCIAMQAWKLCNASLKGSSGDPVGHLTYLESAAILRDGWNPGDPAVRR